MNLQPKCGTCRHYRKRDSGDAGLCIAMPHWEPVDEDHYCGQYAPSISGADIDQAWIVEQQQKQSPVGRRRRGRT